MASEALKVNKSLTTIYLHYNQIGDPGLAALAGALGKGALDQLQVCWRPSAL